MKKIGILIMALVLAVGSLGVGYAMWFDDINVSGSVSTATVSWEFCDCNVLDDVAPPPVYPLPFPILGDWSIETGFIGEAFQLDKNVSWGSCDISADGKVLSFTLNEVYPCNFNNLTFYVRNNGSIPIVYDHMDIWITDPSLPGSIPIATFTRDPQGILYFDMNNNGCPDLEVVYGDHIGDQLEPGGICRNTEISLSFHTLQCAPQGATFQFWITLTAIQWNEYNN